MYRAPYPLNSGSLYLLPLLGNAQRIAEHLPTSSVAKCRLVCMRWRDTFILAIRNRHICALLSPAQTEKVASCLPGLQNVFLDARWSPPGPHLAALARAGRPLTHISLTLPDLHKSLPDLTIRSCADTCSYLPELPALRSVCLSFLQADVGATAAAAWAAAPPPSHHTQTVPSPQQDTATSLGCPYACLLASLSQLTALTHLALVGLPYQHLHAVPWRELVHLQILDLQLSHSCCSSACSSVSASAGAAEGRGRSNLAPEGHQVNAQAVFRGAPAVGPGEATAGQDAAAGPRAGADASPAATASQQHAPKAAEGRAGAGEEPGRSLDPAGAALWLLRQLPSRTAVRLGGLPSPSDDPRVGELLRELTATVTVTDSTTAAATAAAAALPGRPWQLVFDAAADDCDYLMQAAGGAEGGCWVGMGKAGRVGVSGAVQGEADADGGRWGLEAGGGGGGSWAGGARVGDARSKGCSGVGVRVMVVAEETDSEGEDEDSSSEPEASSSSSRGGSPHINSCNSSSSSGSRSIADDGDGDSNGKVGSVEESDGGSDSSNGLDSGVGRGEDGTGGAGARDAMAGGGNEERVHAANRTATADGNMETQCGLTDDVMCAVEELLEAHGSRLECRGDPNGSGGGSRGCTSSGGSVQQQQGAIREPMQCHIGSSKHKGPAKHLAPVWVTSLHLVLCREATSKPLVLHLRQLPQLTHLTLRLFCDTASCSFSRGCPLLLGGLSDLRCLRLLPSEAAAPPLELSARVLGRLAVAAPLLTCLVVDGAVLPAPATVDQDGGEGQGARWAGRQRLSSVGETNTVEPVYVPV